MAAKPSKDLAFANDEQANRTVMIDMNESQDAPAPTGEEPTVVLDLTATQVHDLLTNPDTVLRRAMKK